MTTQERILGILKERGIPVSRMERNLGFSNGYVKGLTKGTVPSDRLSMIADYLNLPIEYLLTGIMPQDPAMESLAGTKYYFSDETAQVAQEIFEKPGLRMLFDAARDAKPEDLITMANLLERLKKTNPDG